MCCDIFPQCIYRSSFSSVFQIPSLRHISNHITSNYRCRIAFLCTFIRKEIVIICVIVQYFTEKLSEKVNPRYLRIFAVNCGDGSVFYKHIKSVMIKLFLIFYSVFCCCLKYHFNNVPAFTYVKVHSTTYVFDFPVCGTLRDGRYLLLAEYISRDIWGHTFSDRGSDGL
jgi:hypothetical protein